MNKSVLLIALLCLCSSVSYAANNEQELEKACSSGKAKSCLDIAVTNLEKGRYYEASRFLYRGCLLNHGQSCAKLGDIYYSVEDVKLKSYVRAKLYYEKACLLEYGYGCYRAAVSYGLTPGIKPDKYLAGEYYRLACQLKYEPACRMENRWGAAVPDYY